MLWRATGAPDAYAILWRKQRNYSISFEAKFHVEHKMSVCVVVAGRDATPAGTDDARVLLWISYGQHSAPSTRRALCRGLSLLETCCDIIRTWPYTKPIAQGQNQRPGDRASVWCRWLWLRIQSKVYGDSSSKSAYYFFITVLGIQIPILKGFPRGFSWICLYWTQVTLFCISSKNHLFIIYCSVICGSSGNEWQLLSFCNNIFP